MYGMYCNPYNLKLTSSLYPSELSGQRQTLAQKEELTKR